MKKHRLAGIVMAFFTLIIPAFAEIHIDVTEGTFKPIPIAITQFEAGGNPSAFNSADQIIEVIKNDLTNCGLFKIVDPNAYIQNGKDVMHAPRFADWKVLNAEALVGGIVRQNGDQLQVDFRVFDVYNQKQLKGLSKATSTSNWRKMAHQIADEIYEALTGDKGYFDTRIVYIAEQGRELDRKYRLAIMDYDGENHQFISSGSTRVLTPRFSPDRSKIAYVDFGKNDKTPTLHVHDLNTGHSETMTSINGQRMSPRFSPHGDHLIMSAAKDGAACLYKLDFRSKKLEKLTKATSTIDVSPCYSPDGSQIVFTSDRGGRPQIYISGANGENAERISFSEGRYDNPVWSPRGDLIAFTRMNRGTFYIGVMRPDGSGERMLDSGYLLEGPTWSPNGREIMYTYQSGPHSKSGIRRVDVTGFHKQNVPIPGEGSYPTW